jgi:hypothetical protein
MRKKSEQQISVVSSFGSAVGSHHESLNGRHEKIARLAYSYWESRAGQSGSPEEDWFRAESEIKTHERRLQREE